jgi:hypothetical protein
MAQVVLSRQDAETGYLPAICIRCGAPANHQVRKEWQDDGHRKVQSWLVAPLCFEHRNHWRARAAITGLSLYLFLGLGLASWTIVPWEPKWVLLLPPVVGLALWSGLTFWLHQTSIRILQIDESNVTLSGVAPDFVESLYKHRLGPQRVVPLALEGKGSLAKVRLVGNELQGGLPPLCICCGEPATTWRERVFRVSRASTQVEGIAQVLLLFIDLDWIVSLGLQRQRRFQTPLCQAHRNHWRIRRLLFWVGLPVAFAGPAAYAAILPAGLLESFIILAGPAIAWLIIWVNVEYSGVRAAEVTLESLTLNGVSISFKDELDRQRQNRSCVLPNQR